MIDDPMTPEDYIEWVAHDTQHALHTHVAHRQALIDYEGALADDPLTASQAHAAANRRLVADLDILLAQTIIERIKQSYGDNCIDFDPDCCVCLAHQAIQWIENTFMANAYDEISEIVNGGLEHELPSIVDIQAEPITATQVTWFPETIRGFGPKE